MWASSLQLHTGLSVALEVLAGGALGYVLASLIESVAHQYVSDAPLRIARLWERYPRLFRYFIRTRYSHHTIHHAKTYRQDHVTQFRSDEERQALDQELLARGSHGRIILASGYAVKLHGSGDLVFVAPLLPWVLLLYSSLGLWVLLGSLLPLAAPPLLSNFAHPYLHMPHARARERAPRLIAWLLGTAYFRAMARNHYMHHRYGKSNFNLLLGGDVLRGAYRRPSPRDLEKMEQLGLPVH